MSVLPSRDEVWIRGSILHRDPAEEWALVSVRVVVPDYESDDLESTEWHQIERVPVGDLESDLLTKEEAMRYAYENADREAAEDTFAHSRHGDFYAVRRILAAALGVTDVEEQR